MPFSWQANFSIGDSIHAFAVSLLHALYALKGQMATKNTLAAQAAHIEIDPLGRTIGAQNHYAAAYGNFNVFTFKLDGSVMMEQALSRPQVISTLEQNMILYFTTVKRNTSVVLKEQDKKTASKFEVLQKMRDMVEPLRGIFSGRVSLNKMGKLLHQKWMSKKSIAGQISYPRIDEYYEAAMRAGALGGNLLGAGGVGFLLLYVEPQNKEAEAFALSELFQMRIKFDSGCTRITYFDQNVY